MARAEVRFFFTPVCEGGGGAQGVKLWVRKYNKLKVVPIKGYYIGDPLMPFLT